MFGAGSPEKKTLRVVEWPVIKVPPSQDSICRRRFTLDAAIRSVIVYSKWSDAGMSHPQTRPSSRRVRLARVESARVGGACPLLSG